MRRTVICGFVAATLIGSGLVCSAQELRYEAEDIVVTEGAWQTNKFSETLWNLWSTDSDAMEKWSEGVVLQSPLVMADREEPEDGAPVLHAVVADLPDGTYAVSIGRVGRPIGLSFDGETWQKQTGASLGEREIADGRFELWLDDRYAADTNPGSCYFDYLVFSRTISSVNGVQNGDFEFAIDEGVAGWSWFMREPETGGMTHVAEGGREGSRCALLEHTGERDFAFSNRGRLAVEAGQEYTATAWVRCEDTADVQLAVVTLAEGKTIQWAVASHGTYGTCDWTRLVAPVRVPKGIDEIYVRVTGTGEARVWVDDVAVTQGWEERPRVQKPLVAGWAEERVVENLGRGVVAMPTAGNQVYVSWRLLASDPDDVAFNVYRSAADSAFEKLNDQPITAACDFVDESPVQGLENTYAVWAVADGVERGGHATSNPVTPSEEGRPYISIPLRGDYTFQKAGIADLDGDGAFDYVIKQPNANVDPYVEYWKPSPSSYKVEAYLSDGSFLWSNDLGWNIEQGIWYSPMVVYDLDGDGKAEVCLKTAPPEDLREGEGRVPGGDEWLSVWDGMTGEEVTRVDWPSREGFSSYNVSSRNQLCVAYLDGKTPCLIVGRGTYGTIKVVAYQYHDGKLEELWNWSDRDEGGRYRGQGAHSMHAVDVDGDGCDEVFLGSAVLDDNGVGLWSTGRGHPDHHYVGDIDPSRPGLEVYYGMETRQAQGGCLLVDAATGEELWGLDEATTHVHSTGMCADIDASRPGMECYSGERDFPEKKWLWAADGELIDTPDLGGLAPRTAYWDADLQREMVRSSRIYDYQGAVHRDDLSGRLVSVADVIGDWREELIVTSEGEIRIYTTTIPADDRRVCLMQDPIYRMDVVIQAMGYTQQPMTTNCLSAGEASLTVGLRERQVTPGEAASLQVAVVAPVGARMKGTVSLTPSAAVDLAQREIAVDVAPGSVERYEVVLTVSGTPSLLGGEANGVVTAVYSGDGGPLEAEASVEVADHIASDMPRVQAEAMSAQGGGEVQVRDDKVGDDGQSISHWDDKEHWLEWKLNAPADGEYYVVLRYCTGFENVRRAQIDGQAIGREEFRFPRTGGFSGSASDWKHLALTAAGEPTPVHLNAGEHTLRLTNVDGKGMNLDYVMLVAAE